MGVFGILGRMMSSHSRRGSHGSKRWVVVVQQDDDGELFIEFPPGTLPDHWGVGTVIEWVDLQDGSWLLRARDEQTNS